MLEIPVYGVCTLDVLAIEAVDTGAVDRDFVVATDARRKEVYLGAYDAEGVRLARTRRRQARRAGHRGAGGRGGSAALPRGVPAGGGPHRPSAGVAGPRRGADERAELVDPEPMYLRRPDAEVTRSRKTVS